MEQEKMIPAVFCDKFRTSVELLCELLEADGRTTDLLAIGLQTSDDFEGIVAGLLLPEHGTITMFPSRAP